ncbi:MAG: beta-glucosidase [Hamadaea sp.]|uniref:GH1 family beta-glucosidase n=1 Tax=Hamadaea sp. TaxID=2024425 RepID=UPI0017CD052B|nr:GH1 family beta-glucosidase [Hamadaea sp.]NUR70376.1 beta-glucosidase [Hamadaea sp.]NUT20536.1 beta-glucosidase [Hamadaea sp.]
MNLPDHFRWGVATSAYQIEGAVAEDGRTDSIWDTFCRVPSAVVNGETGEVACDHYHRMPSDVALMRDLGVGLYRFSVSWPRVQPGGRGPANRRGLDFYDRLVDELQAAGIEPWLTLYHWDLPQELEDAGGWPVRDTALRFADYASLVYDRLGDRIPTWTTLNEPWCSAMLGYAYGRHAPGRTSLADGYAAAHHLLLGHGLAAQRLRTAGAKSLGITLNLGGHEPATAAAADVDAARRAEGSTLRLYLDSLVRGAYPEDVVADLAAQGIRLPIQEGDLEVISTPLDLIGVNYYSSRVHSGEEILATGRPVTAMGWEIVPEGLTRLLVRLTRDYPGVPWWVTENGAAFDDKPDAEGFVDDQDRVAYFASHIDAIAEACRQGADVRGYFAWSLLDNFEWAEGYAKRFGIVRVDYETQQRIPKQSALYYRDVITR